MKFSIGETVAYLHETGKGKVLKYVSDHIVLVEDEHGFEQQYEVKNLVKIYGSPTSDTNEIPLKDKKQEVKAAKYTVLSEKASQNKDYWELDLHIEELTDSHRGLSNFEILQIQMNKFKQFFSSAHNHNIKKIVVIHGVGEGVLKNEIRSYLSGKEGIEFFDASYLDYGKGATEIRFWK